MLLLGEVLSKANKFREMALKMNVEFEKTFNRIGIIPILERDPHKTIEAAKQGQIPFSGANGALTLLKLKKCLLDTQSLFYDFSEFLEPVDLLPYLKRSEYKYIMAKVRENNEDIASACKIGNVMFATTLREVVNDNKRWGLMLYRIKEKWRRQNIKRVV